MHIKTDTDLKSFLVLIKLLLNFNIFILHSEQKILHKIIIFVNKLFAIKIFNLLIDD